MRTKRAHALRTRRPLLIASIGAAAAILAVPLAVAGRDTPGAVCGSNASSLSLCRGIDVLIDGPWVYKDMGLAYRSAKGTKPVRWRVLLAAHKTVAIDFTVSTSVDRFQTFRRLDVYLPSMRFRAAPRGSTETGVTIDGGHLRWRSTPLSRVGRGGFSFEWLSITLPTTQRQLCPRLVATFTDRVLTYKPVCWQVKTP